MKHGNTRLSDKPGAQICEQVFGDDWPKCVSPHGRKTLKERVESNTVEITNNE